MHRMDLFLCCLAVGLGGSVAAAADSCVLGPQPAASLLIPYFEVDLDQPGGRTTLLAVSNTSAEAAAVARLVLWTDWGVPSLATLRASHVGSPNPEDGLCYASPRSDLTRATGYATVDLLERSSTTVVFQSDAGYFQGADPLASSEKLLAGDFFLVETEEAFAQGFEAVHLVAQPEKYSQAGGPSFYGAFVGGSGADARLPLSTRHQARFFVGSPAVAGTDLLVWLANGVVAAPQECGDGPPWFQLGIPDLDVAGVDEDANELKTFVRENPLRAQILRVGTDVPVPVASGALEVTTRVRDAIGAPPHFDPVQGWVAPIMSAFGQYSVGWNAIRLDDGCVTLAD